MCSNKIIDHLTAQVTSYFSLLISTCTSTTTFTITFALPVEELWFGGRALGALKRLVPLRSTFLCEAGFSARVCMKSKSRS